MGVPPMHLANPWARRPCHVLLKRERMIDLKDLRENPDKYRRGAQLKGVNVDIDAILRLEGERVAAQREFEQFRSQQNEASKEIGKLKDPQAKMDAIARMGKVKEKVKAAEERAKAAAAAVEPL